MKQGLFLIFAFCAISNTYAEADCLQRPSCEELGYTQTLEECAGRSILPCPFNIADPNTVFCGNIGDADISCEEKCKTAYPLFAGQENTKAAVDQIGNEALAAYAASQFYVGDKHGDFGQGKWYLPSIGEWMYFYGTDVAQMTSGGGTTGATGDNKNLINNALNALADKGVDAAALSTTYDTGYYWSSSEHDIYQGLYSWFLYGRNGYRYNFSKIASYSLRCSQLLKNIFNPSVGGAAPQIGDVMYLDKTYGAAADYDGSKTPVGIVSSVSKDGHDVTIINLKNLTFTSQNTAGNFNSENPYGSSEKLTRWASTVPDITGIPNIDENQFLELAKASDNCPCQFYPPEDGTSDDTCTGTNKCKDASGNCVDCYKSCSAYNSSYKDSQPSGQSCSTTAVMIGAGNGATASSKTCYYDCSTVDTCTGANKCKDSSGNCITCYSSCSAYNSSYKDSQPSGQTCSTKSVMIGAGNGATATSKTCYYDCSTVDTCTGSSQCKDSSGNCVDCYTSCEDAGYLTSSPSEYHRCSSISVWIGSGNGATAASTTCYYSCSTCGGDNCCMDPEKGVTQLCYPSCSGWGYDYPVDSIPDGYECPGNPVRVLIGEGKGKDGTYVTCARSCYEIPNCTGEHTCRSKDKCVECYESCPAWGEALFTNSTEHLVGGGVSAPEGAMCDSQRQSYYIGSGNGANATITYCTRCIW